MSERTMTSPAARPLRRVLAPVLTAALVLFAAAPAQAVLYTVTFNQDIPSVDTFVGTFEADSAAIMAGSGALTSFSITLGPETFDLTDMVGPNSFVSNGVDVTGIRLRIDDTASSVRLNIFTTGFWGTAERGGEYDLPVRVGGSTPVPEPGTFGLMGVGLVALGFCAVRRRRDAAVTP